MNFLRSLFDVESKPSKRLGGHTVTATAAKPANIRLSARMNTALNAQAKALHISKAALVRQALEEKLEDLFDLRLVEERSGEPTVSHSVFWKKIGLES